MPNNFIKENILVEKVEPKPTYEPVEIQVNAITPIGILCASGASPSSASGFSIARYGSKSV